MAKMTDELVMKCFQIVAQVGAARSYYINAIQCAKEGKFEDAERMIKEGDVSFNQGHTEHTSLLSMEASGELDGSGLLLIHAEDQLMSAEGFRIDPIEEPACQKGMQKCAVAYYFNLLISLSISDGETRPIDLDNTSPRLK